MTRGVRWLCPEAVFDGAVLQHACALRVEEGRIAALVPVADVPPDARRPLSGLLSPGFVDLQVNGGGGVLLNADPSVRAMRAIARAHRGFGTVAILPTVITDAPPVLARAVEAALEARHAPGIAGLHIEGPHIAAAKRGTHTSAHIRPLDDTTVALVLRLRAAEVPVMLTLAPEAATPDRIATLAEAGAIVSLGHSAATAPQAREAFAAGAVCVTHLFNAMSQMQARAPGLVGAALASDRHAGIICDGVHVDDTMVALAFRARPVPDRMMLVSDAMPTVGGPEAFTLYGRTVRLRDGRLVNDEGALAGAHVTLAESVARLAGPVGLPLETALRAAITVPSRLMGLGLDRIVNRPVADLVHLEHDGRMRDAAPFADGAGPRP